MDPPGYKEGDELFPKDDKDQVLFSEVDYVETWQALESLVESGMHKLADSIAART